MEAGQKLHLYDALDGEENQLNIARLRDLLMGLCVVGVLQRPRKGHRTMCSCYSPSISSSLCSVVLESQRVMHAIFSNYQMRSIFPEQAMSLFKF